jgi:N6-adenosine-specific RNA methylase IME4
VKAIQIDRAFSRLIAPLSPDEHAQLEANIKQSRGARDPLVVWQGLLVDGHNRHEICERLHLPYKVTELQFPDRLAAQIWIRWNQLGRRNLTDDQRAIQADGLIEDLARQSKRVRATTAGKTGGIGRPKNSLRETSTRKLSDKTSARTKTSKRARVSEHKVRQARKVRLLAPHLLPAVVAGDLSLADALRETKRAEIKAQLESIDVRTAKEIEGVYDVVVIDPPWPTAKIERDEREEQAEFDYPRMTVDELKELPIPCADACHVWLWATQRFLPTAFELLTTWGLTYVCTFVWHKPGGFQPINLPQYNCEFALYARKGSAAFLETKEFATCFNALRGAHSEKPAAFYDVVRRVTAGRRLDMFNRRRIDGFEGWGKEAAA